MVFEPPRGVQQVPLFRKRYARQLERWRSAVVAIKQRLGIECVDMRGSTFHEQKDDAPSTASEVWLARRQRIGGIRGLGTCPRVIAEHGGKRQVSKSYRRTLQQSAATLQRAPHSHDHL